MNYEFENIEIPQHGFEAMASLINRQIDGMEKLWSDFAKYPYGEVSDNLETTTSLHTEAVEEALHSLRDQCVSEEEVRERTFLYVTGLETRRAAMLEKLFGESEISNFMLTPRAITPDEMITVCEAFDDATAASTDGVEIRDEVEIASEYYANVFQQDMLELERCAIIEYVNRPEARRTEIASKIGRHCLDIAKVGVGVVVGIAVAKRSKLL